MTEPRTSREKPRPEIKQMLRSSFEEGYCVECGQPIYDDVIDKCSDCERVENAR